MASGKYDPAEFRERAQFQREVSELRDVPITELLAAFELADIEALCGFQEIAKEDPPSLATDPLSTEFREKYELQADLLLNNTTTYDPELEDELVEDKVVEALMMERRELLAQLNSPLVGEQVKNLERRLQAAIRARRSVLAYIFNAGLLGNTGTGG